MKAAMLLAASAALLIPCAAVASPVTAVTVDFSNGTEGWLSGDFNNTADPSLGNPAPSLHAVTSNFGVYFQNQTNPAFTGDYTVVPSLMLSADLLTNSINHFGAEISRDLYLTLTDFGQNGAPDATVYYDLGTLHKDPSWKTLSVTIGDTSATALPAGWTGFGNPNGSQTLPDGRTFGNVLANIDRIEFTTFQPGFAYFSVYNDIAIDNIGIAPLAGGVPEPASWALMLTGFGLAGGIARRGRERRVTASA